MATALFATQAMSVFTATSAASSALGAFAAISGANATAKGLEAEARFADFDAEQERIAGLQTASAIREQLAREIATANAYAGAGNIDITFGSPAVAVRKAATDAERNYQITLNNAVIAGEKHRFRAGQLRFQGKQAKFKGRVEAIGGLLDFASNAAAVAA